MNKTVSKKLIATAMTAIFLFIAILSPLTVYAADSSSENETEEDYTWEDALNDEEYKENLAEMVARYWATNWINYVGTGSDVVQDISDLIGDSYDNNKDLYDNLYPYILPYTIQTVNNLDLSDIKESYGKPYPKQNNLNLINDVAREFGEYLPTLIPSGGNVFEDIASDKGKSGDDITPSGFPSWFRIAFKFPAANLPSYPSDYNANGQPAVIMKNMSSPAYYERYAYFYNNDNNSLNYNVCYLDNTRGEMRYCLYTYDHDGNLLVNDKIGWITYGGNNFASMEHTKVTQDNGMQFGATHYTPGNPLVYFYGTGYIYYYDEQKCYFWDQDSRTLSYLGTGTYKNFFGKDGSDGTLVDNYTVNIINTVDFDEYQQLIDQLMLDVNMSNNITNSLLIELIKELRNQRNNYVQQDDDDIYDYIDYMMVKLNETKDIHIEIPDISPDLGGIADGISALLNFLASIIRAVGNIVSSLLDGLFHLIVPTEQDWNDLSVQFNSLTAPLEWIKEFIGEGFSAISMCLFGRNVTDFELPETEPEVVQASVNTRAAAKGNDNPLKGKIVYDPDSGAPKIPVRFSNSTSEYFSDIEDAYIIDLNWYAPYKPVGDMIVVAFCWILFVWRVLHDLPGIISGATGITDNRPDSAEGYSNKWNTYDKFIGR